MSTSNHGRLQEYSSAQATPIRVDVVKGILFDVLILGHGQPQPGGLPAGSNARGGRQVRRRCGICRSRARRFSNPDYDRKLGVIRNPRVTAEGIRGDLHFPPKHRLAEQLVWDATTNPRNLGLSHDADCTWTIGPMGRKRITSINRVHSVDLVTRSRDQQRPVGIGRRKRSWQA